VPGTPTRKLSAPSISTGAIQEIHRIDRELSRPAFNAGRTHLVIPDGHAKPNDGAERFDYLGKFLVDLRPDVVVDIGDMADMQSLSIYDGSRAVGGPGGNKSFEGRRYKADIAAAVNARKRIMLPLERENARLRQAGESIIPVPELHSCEGNHEQRIRRVAQHIPEFDGVVGIDDLRIKELGWNFYRLCEPAIIDGVAYAHYIPSGTKRMPISGVNHARSLIVKTLTSTTVGNSHLRDFSEIATLDGRRIIGLVAGCFFECDGLQWSGVVVKRGVMDGNYDHQWISLEWLMATYGQ
jgi:hypothetical protein